METITQEKIQGIVGSVENKGDYIVKFIVKAIQEGKENWVNVSSSDWQAWRLQEGDEVSLTGRLTSTVWEYPFLSERMETLEMETSEIKFAA